MANEIKHTADVGGGGGGDIGNSPGNIRRESKLFRDYAFSHESTRDLFESLARDHISLTGDQRGDRLLAISNALAELRDETEVTRAGIRTLALEYLKGQP